MRVNYDPAKGRHNIDNLYKEVGVNNIQINSIRAEEYSQSQQRYRIADIEELPAADSNMETVDEASDTEANVNFIMVNRVPIGEACSPYEIIRVQTESGLFPIVIIYDTGSEVLLCNYETGNKKVTISTINSMQAKLRQVYKLALNDGWSMEAIMIPNMKLQLQAQIIPEEWQDLNGEWADQEIYGVAAQILLGADQATLFPHAVKDWTGSLLQVNQSRLSKVKPQGDA